MRNKYSIWSLINVLDEKTKVSFLGPEEVEEAHNFKENKFIEFGKYLSKHNHFEILKIGRLWAPNSETGLLIHLSENHTSGKAAIFDLANFLKKIDQEAGFEIEINFEKEIWKIEITDQKDWFYSPFLKKRGWFDYEILEIKTNFSSKENKALPDIWIKLGKKNV